MAEAAAVEADASGVAEASVLAVAEPEVSVAPDREKVGVEAAVCWVRLGGAAGEM